MSRQRCGWHAEGKGAARKWMGKTEYQIQGVGETGWRGPCLLSEVAGRGMEDAKGDEISCRDLKETLSLQAFNRKQFSLAVPPLKANQRACALLIKSCAERLCHMQ